jgi:DNA-binding phage protein
MLTLHEYVEAGGQSPSGGSNGISTTPRSGGRTTNVASERTEEPLPLTRHFRETVAARAGRDPAFREGLLREGIEALLAGDIGTGKAVLRDYINATVGFEALGAATGLSAKSLMRMFGPNGNPQAQNLFAVLGHLQKHANLRMEVRSVRRRRPGGGTTRVGARAG